MTPVRISVAAAIGSVLLILIVLELIRGRRLKERYALLWLVTGGVLLILSAWRGGLNTIAGWLGVSGYRLTYEGVSIFVDPYLSRVPLRALLLRRRTLPDQGMIERYAGAPGDVAGVLVGHTHFDHAVDAPALARRYGTKAYGSASLAHLMRLHGLGDYAWRWFPTSLTSSGRSSPTRLTKWGDSFETELKTSCLGHGLSCAALPGF